MNIFSINLTLAANVDDANGSLAEAIAEIMPALIEEFNLDETGNIFNKISTLFVLSLIIRPSSWFSVKNQNLLKLPE